MVNLGPHEKSVTLDVRIERGGPVGKTRIIYLGVMGLVTLLLVSGCANYGKLRVQYRSDTSAAMKHIMENYDQYIIHANEWPAGEVCAIVFDPKGDDKTIENDGWTEVTSQEQLSKLVTLSKRNIYRQFFKIFGPNEDFYGYLLGGPQYVWIETVDANTLKLHSVNWVPHRGHRYDPFM